MNTVFEKDYINEALLGFLIKEDIPLNDKNWFQTGGSARYFAEPSSSNEFAQTLAFAQINNLPVFVLGLGANILISDEGFKGLVIRPRIIACDVIAAEGEDILVRAGSGMSMDELIEYCLAHNILGLEEFSGIPGTVGGSVYINLHYFQFLLAQFLTSATVIHATSGEIKTVDTAWFNFGYNQSTLQSHEWFLIDATFRLKKGSDHDIAYARGRRVEIIRHRVARYPAKKTCGSFFRNFHEHEVSLVSNGKKMIYVAYYLDKIGVKGVLNIGGAIVSYQHANMLVNQGDATSSDIIALARAMQKLVYDQFQVLPQAECLFIGFDEYPLYTADTIIKQV